jgi:hypothetical protein
MVDIAKAAAFMATHARLLDRRRAGLLLGDGDVEAALSALGGYRNPDGGFGWGIEPDLRAPSSQPVGALHAFEVLEEIAPATSPLAARLCDWLGEISLPGGGLPFVLPGAGFAGSSPVWSTADPSLPSLHLTTCIAAIAHRVGRHDQAVAEHAWLRRATGWCMAEIAGYERPQHAIEFRYVLQFLDAVDELEPQASAQLGRLAAFLPPSGAMPVTGGKPDEAMRPLDFAPRPGRPLRSRLDPRAVSQDLDRVEAEQDDDGGWHVDWEAWSPAGGLEWRGWATVRALQLLAANGRLAR